LTIGPVNDVYEREADRVAEQVMRMPDSAVQSRHDHLTAGTNIRRIPDGGGGGLNTSLDIQLNESGGRPLSLSTRRFMEPRLGVDFGHVRLHTGQDAHQAASQVYARAFTHGTHIWLEKGESEQNKKLMAHELTHVVQQGEAGRVVSTNNLPSGANQQGRGVAKRDGQGHVAKITASTSSAVVMRQEMEPVELSLEELSAEMDRVSAEMDRVPVGSVEWVRLFERLETLREEFDGLFFGRGMPGRATDNPALEITSPLPGETFNTDASPRMPNIPFVARIEGVEPDPTHRVPFEWQFEVVETVAGDTCASARIGECRERWAESVTGGIWRPTFGRTIIGGEATLRVRARVHGLLLAADVTNIHIRGTNPGAAAITARAGGAGTTGDRVACHESSRQQFDASGMPLLGPGGDVGVMQLCNPAATCQQRWDWTANVDQGLALFGDKQAAALGYLNNHRIDGNYPNSLGLSNAAVLERESIKRYNGGHYWEWDDDVSQWVNNPDPGNNYVANVLGCI
jgi:hypothetical protein